MATIVNYSWKKQDKGGEINPSSTKSFKLAKMTELTNVSEWIRLIQFWRSHLDIFIEDYLSCEENKIEFYPFQKVIVRAFGNFDIIRDVESRGLGKTWKMSLVFIALSILYPGNKILVGSKTANQAILVIKYIQDLSEKNPNIARELVLPISIQKDRAIVKFKNGSVITAKAMGKDGVGFRGERAKIVYIDEACWVNNYIITSVVLPILEYKRDWYFNNKNIPGVEDFESKLFETTSANLKSWDFFERLKETYDDMRHNKRDAFGCCISYKTGLRVHFFSERKIARDKHSMTDEEFEMEYGAKFLGNVEGSFYPYALVNPTRTLEEIELMENLNKKEKSSKNIHYVASMDIATSGAKTADNAVLSVVRFEIANDTIFKKLVYMHSYHGNKLYQLAQEIRKICILFPDIEKVIVDANAIGSGIIDLLGVPYVDDQGAEHQPFVTDDLIFAEGAIPIIQAYTGNNEENNRGAFALKLFLENQSLKLPAPYIGIIKSVKEEANKSEFNKIEDVSNGLTKEEAAVFMEADALQVELGNIKPIPLASGVKYDVVAGKHKDRYSSLMMACLYIYNIEQSLRKESQEVRDNECLAISLHW